jgi:hypothetical protein
MPRKRIESKKKIDSYKKMKLWDSLYTALVWTDLDRINLDWHNKKLIKELWARHGKFIMKNWEQDHTNAGRRPKIWWHVFTEESDFKILRYEKHMNMSDTKPEPVYIADGSLQHEYPVYEGQTAYLYRNNLLSEGEIKELIKENPDMPFEDEEEWVPCYYEDLAGPYPHYYKY